VRKIERGRGGGVEVRGEVRREERGKGRGADEIRGRKSGG